jgi:UDP-glucose 4-epimerase
MRCVVIGGGGFIGSHLCEALLAGGHEVRVFDRLDARFLAQVKDAGASVYTGDFLNQAELRDVLTDYEVVYHLISATVPQTSNDNPIFDVEANILGTLRLLDAAKDAHVKKIIFASSGGTVYGIPKEIPIKEIHPTDPTSSYGITKLTIEKYLYLYSTLYGLNYCILRIANAYGERQPITGTQGVIGAFLDKALHNAEITVWGDGTIMRDYIYVGDIVSAFIKAGMYESEPRVFNVGAGRGHSLNDIISVIENIVQVPLQVKYLEGRQFDVPINVLDISRAKLHLNWEPKVWLDEGILCTLQWMQKHPNVVRNSRNGSN